MAAVACATSMMAAESAARHFSLLEAALESIEGRSEALALRMGAAEAAAAAYKSKVQDAEAALSVAAARLESMGAEQVVQAREVTRLSALLEASQLHAELSSEQLLSDLEDERLRSERLRAVRDDALLQRDDALSELANAYADIEAMQATLADSALYVRQLRARVSELERLQRQAAGQQARNDGHKAQTLAQDRQDARDQGPFSLASIKASIQAAVAETAAEPEAERKRRIRQLQLRWHPDKNPVLREFATEVSKIINEAVAALEP